MECCESDAGTLKETAEEAGILNGAEEGVMNECAQQNDDEVNVHVHVASDWPKDLERRSLSGGMMIITGITGGTLEEDASAASVFTTAEAEQNTPCNVTFSLAHAYSI